MFATLQTLSPAAVGFIFFPRSKLLTMGSIAISFCNYIPSSFLSFSLIAIPSLNVPFVFPPSPTRRPAPRFSSPYPLLIIPSPSSISARLSHSPSTHTPPTPHSSYSSSPSACFSRADFTITSSSSPFSTPCTLSFSASQTIYTSSSDITFVATPRNRCTSPSSPSSHFSLHIFPVSHLSSTPRRHGLDCTSSTYYASSRRLGARLEQLACTVVEHAKYNESNRFACQMRVLLCLQRVE